MNSAKARLYLRYVLGLAALVAAGILFLLVQEDPQMPPPVDLSLRSASPEAIRVRYRPGPVPPDLGSSAQAAPAEPLRRWHLQPGQFRGPLAWCPATAKLAFFRDGWVWITDGQGSRVRTLWFEPDLAAAGRLAWSQDGRQLWIRADGWRHWLCLGLDLESPRGTP